MRLWANSVLFRLAECVQMPLFGSYSLITVALRPPKILLREHIVKIHMLNDIRDGLQEEVTMTPTNTASSAEDA